MADDGKKYDALDRRNAPEIYRLIDDLVKAHHSSDLCDARIGAMYVYDVKPDCDEIVWWAKACLVSGKAQEYEPHDFRIEINFTVWNTLTNDQKRAVMDHELCHCGRLEDEKTGESRYYSRKHDLEEFHEIVERYGPKWRPAVEEFVKRATGQQEPTLFDGVEPKPDEAPKTGAARLLHSASRAEPVQVTLTTPDGKSVTTTAAGLANAVKESRRMAASDRRTAWTGT